MTTLIEFLRPLILCSALLLVAIALQAQRTQEGAASECLVTLQAPSSDFGEAAETSGARVLAHTESNLVWLINAESHALKRVQDIATVKAVKPAFTVVVTVTSDAPDLRLAIEALGGIMLQRYQNLPALSAAIPATRVSNLQNLPGVEHVKKDAKVNTTAIQDQTHR